MAPFVRIRQICLNAADLDWATDTLCAMLDTTVACECSAPSVCSPLLSAVLRSAPLCSVPLLRPLLSAKCSVGSAPPPLRLCAA